MDKSIKYYEKQSLMADFLHESRGYNSQFIDLIGRGLESLHQSRPVYPSLINDLFRHIHTIKGTSGYMGLDPIRDLAHEMENLLEKLREGQIQVSADVLVLLSQSSKELESLFQAAENKTLHQKNTAVLMDCLSKCGKGISLASPENHEFSLMADQTLRVNKSKYAELILHLRDIYKLLGDLQKQTFRIDEELVSLKKSESLSGTSLKGLLNVSSHLEHTFDQLTRHYQEVEFLSQIARLQSLGGLLNRFKSLAQDLAVHQTKQVRIEIKGIDCEADSLICDRLSSMMVHLIRNMIDHGVESPEERLKVKKPDSALIQIAASVSRDELIVEVSDDGRGIDANKLVEKAIEKEFITESELSVMSFDDKIGLIFVPGISTADSISSTSGRGVGMDVVLKSVEELGGTLKVATQKNKGTQFQIRLPRFLNLDQTEVHSIFPQQVVSQ
jgi:two-component system chemotaxis sensor kinase CheA